MKPVSHSGFSKTCHSQHLVTDRPQQRPAMTDRAFVNTMTALHNPRVPECLGIPACKR